MRSGYVEVLKLMFKPCLCEGQPKGSKLKMRTVHALRPSIRKVMQSYSSKAGNEHKNASFKTSLELICSFVVCF